MFPGPALRSPTLDRIVSGQQDHGKTPDAASTSAGSGVHASKTEETANRLGWPPLCLPFDLGLNRNLLNPQAVHPEVVNFRYLKDILVYRHRFPHLGIPFQLSGHPASN